MRNEVTDAEVTAAVERGKREIVGDVRSGRVPRAVASFSELHDYVDANEYGGICDDEVVGDLSNDAFLDIGNRVQEALAEWIVGGGIAEAVPAAYEADGADLEVPLATGAAMLLADLLSHDADMLGVLVPDIDMEVVARIRATLAEALKEG